ncbi:hypothetical protein FB451DRAFT_1055705, partial [Mycena latifolia]
KVWRLGTANSDGMIEHEVVFRMQGILSTAELSLTSSMARTKATKAAFFSQKLQLVGMGSDLFEKAISNLDFVRDIFVRSFPGRVLQPWPAGLRESVIHASSNFFTRVADDPTAIHIDVGGGVDPFNSMQQLQTHGLVHTEENVVKYYKLVRDAITGYFAFPANFRPGDIVEIRGSIVAVPCKKSAFKLHYHLNSVVRLDNTYSSVSITYPDSSNDLY